MRRGAIGYRKRWPSRTLVRLCWSSWQSGTNWPIKSIRSTGRTVPTWLNAHFRLHPGKTPISFSSSSIIRPGCAAFTESPNACRRTQEAGKPAGNCGQQDPVHEFPAAAQRAKRPCPHGHYVIFRNWRKRTILPQMTSPAASRIQLQCRGQIITIGNYN